MSELLTNRTETLRVLEKYGIHAKKKYGQNFLVDANIVAKIMDAAGIDSQDCVLEIGPGIGTMTQHLDTRAGHVVAVEIDRGLEPVLAETLQDCSRTTVLFQDILKSDIGQIRQQYAGEKRMKCVANLPYYITTPVLMQLLQAKDCFESITVMVQKEVADRITASAGNKEYGALSVAMQYYARPEIVCMVPPSCFMPRPGVDSCVLHLEAFGTPPVDAAEAEMFALVRAAFNQRRKTLANAVSHGFSFGGRKLLREEVEAALAKMGLPADVRGERLTLEQFGQLSRLLF